MKKILQSLAFLFTTAVVMVACEKDENRLQFEGGTAPVLTASRSTLPLTFATAANEAIRFSWTNPDFQFNTGVSSQTVTYQLEIDTAGKNFTSPNKRSISMGSDLSRSFTQSEINDALLNGLELTAGRTYNLEVRVKASIGSSVPLYSNVMKYVVTPYAIPPKVEPYTNEVYIVGNATAGGWNNPVPAPAQKLTQISPTQYEITLPLVGGNEYLFLPENGSWSRKYGFDGANATNPEMGGDLKREGGNIKAPGTSGTYKIEVNFQTGKFKLTKI